VVKLILFEPVLVPSLERRLAAADRPGRRALIEEVADLQ
jgi:hypothetical protein